MTWKNSLVLILQASALSIITNLWNPELMAQTQSVLGDRSDFINDCLDEESFADIPDRNFYCACLHDRVLMEYTEAELSAPGWPEDMVKFDLISEGCILLARNFYGNSNRSAAIEQQFVNLGTYLWKISQEGVYYWVAEEGNGTYARDGDRVRVYYVLEFFNPNGELDSNTDDAEPLEFTLGERTMIPGFEIATKLVSEGGEVITVLPYRLAYGATGLSNVIPPYTDLALSIRLVEIVR